MVNHETPCDLHLQADIDKRWSKHFRAYTKIHRSMHATQDSSHTTQTAKITIQVRGF